MVAAEVLEEEKKKKKVMSEFNESDLPDEEAPKEAAVHGKKKRRGPMVAS